MKCTPLIKTEMLTVCCYANDSGSYICTELYPACLFLYPFQFLFLTKALYHPSPPLNSSIPSSSLSYSWSFYYYYCYIYINSYINTTCWLHFVFFYAYGFRNNHLLLDNKLRGSFFQKTSFLFLNQSLTDFIYGYEPCESSPIHVVVSTGVKIAQDLLRQPYCHDLLVVSKRHTLTADFLISGSCNFSIPSSSMFPEACMEESYCRRISWDWEPQH